HRDGEGQARQHPLAVEVHGAGAALAPVAALLGAGEPEPVAQRVEQGHPRVERQPVLAAVDDQPDVRRHSRNSSTTGTSTSGWRTGRSSVSVPGGSPPSLVFWATSAAS